MAAYTGAERERAFRDALSQLGAIFWDTQPDLLDIDRNRRYIIARMLHMGGMRGILWVEALYSDEDIIDAVRSRRDVLPAMRLFMERRHGAGGAPAQAARPWR